MCERYVLVSKIEKIEKTFNVFQKTPLLYKERYNIGAGGTGLIITSGHPTEMQTGQFGFSPSGSEKRLYLINARAEGGRNKEDNPEYSGAMNIIVKPVFREAIRNKRCLVIADCFYAGDKDLGLNKPHLVYLKERRPFAFAGVYNEWTNPETGENILTYAIITIYPNELMLKINCNRCPVILKGGQERKYLNPDSSLATIMHILEPYPSGLMNAYPVSAMVNDVNNNSKELVQSKGQKIYAEEPAIISSRKRIKFNRDSVEVVPEWLMKLREEEMKKKG